MDINHERPSYAIQLPVPVVIGRRSKNPADSLMYGNVITFAESMAGTTVAVFEEANTKTPHAIPVTEIFGVFPMTEAGAHFVNEAILHAETPIMVFSAYQAYVNDLIAQKTNARALYSLCLADIDNALRTVKRIVGDVGQLTAQLSNDHLEMIRRCITLIVDRARREDNATTSAAFVELIDIILNEAPVLQSRWVEAGDLRSTIATQRRRITELENQLALAKEESTHNAQQ